MPLLVVGVMFQVILTGGIFPVAGHVGLEQVSWISPSRWGFAATASTVNLNKIGQPVLTGTAAGVTRAAPSTASAASTGNAGSTGRTGGTVASAAEPAAGPTAPTDPIWAHNSSTWLKDVGLMLILGLAFSGLTWWRLIKIRPGRRR
jgi:hypothetical protein